MLLRVPLSSTHTCWWMRCWRSSQGPVAGQRTVNICFSMGKTTVLCAPLQHFIFHSVSSWTMSSCRSGWAPWWWFYVESYSLQTNYCIHQTDLRQKIWSDYSVQAKSVIFPCISHKIYHNISIFAHYNIIWINLHSMQSQCPLLMLL